MTRRHCIQTSYLTHSQYDFIATMLFCVSPVRPWRPWRRRFFLPLTTLSLRRLSGTCISSPITIRSSRPLCSSSSLSSRRVARTRTRTPSWTSTTSSKRDSSILDFENMPPWRKGLLLGSFSSSTERTRRRQQRRLLGSRRWLLLLLFLHGRGSTSAELATNSISITSLSRSNTTTTTPTSSSGFMYFAAWDSGSVLCSCMVAAWRGVSRVLVGGVGGLLCLLGVHMCL